MRTSLLLSLLVAAAALPAQDREFGTSVRTTLTQVRAEPDAFRNVKIVFDVQYASLGKLSNPFFTRFTPTDYTNLYVWADEQPIWRQGAYEDLFGTLFYPKLGDRLEEVYKLRTYQRLQVTGIVRNTFQGVPWIEISEFQVLPGQVDLAVLTHLYRGEQLMDQRRWQRAIAELSLATGEGVPDTARQAVHRGLGVCFLRIGEPGRAMAHLQTAVQLGQQTDLELERMLVAAKEQPLLEIDRTVDSSGLRDFERPMWEAFEDGKTSKLSR